jgi:hypothetical protein
MNTFIKSTYSNLTEQRGIITTKTQFINSEGIKVLEYGFDPYRNESVNTLFYYDWDQMESKVHFEDFQKQLKDFFTSTYNKEISNVRPLYIGWNKKEKGTY